ncbi:unnamed protein product [Parnassius apollo]|uniref:(apollo) hypothetical protein n=1 Tax=Parnassius apollo TaxID=110799 RepID=A0A8S3Y107_PARAO|nr:unnamed protein product [Parnassius apollo]
MPRNYQRKAPNRYVVTDEQLEAGKLLIVEGATKRKAASQVGKENTLRKSLKLGKKAESMGRYFSTFTKAQEEEIYQYIKTSY